MNPIEEDEFDSDHWGLIIVAILFIGLLAALFQYAKTGNWQPRTTKSELANRYGLQKFESLAKWIEKFCPQDIVDKYVGNQKHLIVPSELYLYLGNPDDYPLDKKGRKITNKKELARAFVVEHKTISRRLKGMDNFENSIGMSYSIYKGLKQIPPLQMSKVVNTLISLDLPLGGKK